MKFMNAGLGLPVMELLRCSISVVFIIGITIIHFRESNFGPFLALIKWSNTTCPYAGPVTITTRARKNCKADNKQILMQNSVKNETNRSSRNELFNEKTVLRHL